LRRKEKEIIDKKEIESIIERATVGRIGMSENNLPYVIPVNFGYKNNFLYFHSGSVGKKIDIIKKNNKISDYLILSIVSFAKARAFSISLASG